MAASGAIQDMIKNLQEAIIQSNQVVFEEKEQLKLKIQELTEENEILREANSKFTSVVPHDALQDLKNKIERLKTDFELERNIHENEKQFLRSQIESFTEERAKLTETIMKLEVESNRLLKDVKDLNEQNFADIPYLKDQLLEYTKLKAAMEADEVEYILVMESKLAESNKKNEELESQLLQLQADLSAQKTELEKQLDLHNCQLESAKETESKLAESNKKNEELEAQLLQLQADLSAQKTELEKQMVLHNCQVESAKETESKLAESNQIQVDLKAQLPQADLSALKNHKDMSRSQLEWTKETESKLEESSKINKYLEAKFSQKEDSIFLERTEFQELMDLYRSISDFVQENVSKLVETNELNESLTAKVQQLRDELSLETTEKEALLDSYNILLESTKITEAKLVETTELNESLQAQLLEQQDELSTERSEIIEIIDLCKNQVESAQESETKRAQTLNQIAGLKCELLELDNYLSLETELKCQLRSFQELFKFLKEIDSKLAKISKLIGELNVTQLLQLQDKLSDHSTELLEEVDAYKKQLESANFAKSKLAEEVMTVLRASSKRLDASSNDDLSLDSSNKDDLFVNNSSSKEDLSDIFSQSSKCLQTIADPELPKVLDEVTNCLVDFIKCREESSEEKPSENIKLVGEGLQTFDQTQMYITLLKENLKDYRNELCGQSYTQPSKYLEYGPSGIYLTLVDHQLKLNELVNKFNIDILIKENEISSSSNLKLNPEMSGATLNYLKTERFYYLALWMVYKHICTKNKLTITDKECQEVAATLKVALKDLKNSMVELKKKLQTATSVKEQAEINSKIKETGLRITDIEGKLHYVPTLFKKRQNENSDRLKDVIKHKCAAESFYQAQKLDLDIEDQLQTELKTPGLAREVLDSFSDLLQKSLFKLGTLSCDTLNFVNDQISKLATYLSSNAPNHEVIEYLKYLRTAQTEIESQSKFINDVKLCDENLVEMTKKITEWELKIVSVKLETNKRICEGLIRFELDSLQNKFKSLNIDSKMAEDFFGALCKFEQDKCNLLTFSIQVEKENSEIKEQLKQTEKELKETLEKYENIKKKSVCLNVNNPSASKSDGSDLTRLEKALANKNSEIICLEDDNQKLAKEIAALKKKSQKMADTKETEKSDLKKEIKTLQDEKIKLQKNIDKLKLDITKLKEKHSRQNSELEESFKRDLINVVEEKNKILADYKEINIKYNECNDVIRSKNAEINDLKQKIEAKCDSFESENLKRQIQQDRNLFRQRQKQLEDKIQKLDDENQNLKESNLTMSQLLESELFSDPSRELKLQNEISDLKKAELKMQKLIADNKTSEASLKLQLQNLIADSKKTELKMQKLIADNKTSEASLKLQLQNLIADSKKTELKMQQLMIENNNSEASLKLQLQNVIADSKKTELKMQQLMAEKNTSETSLKLQLQHVIAGSKKTELKMQQLMADSKATEASLKLQLQNVIAGSKKTELKMQQLMADSKATEASLKLQLQNVIAGSKKTELKMQQLMADSKATEASLKLQLQNVEGNAKTAETIKELRTDFERAIFLVHEVENIIYEILENDLSCPLCHESMVQSNILNCNHSFCEACIRDWSENMQRECPVCHSPILMQKQAVFLDTMIKNLSCAYEKLNEFANNFSTAVAASNNN